MALSNCDKCWDTPCTCNNCKNRDNWFLHDDGTTTEQRIKRVKEMADFEIGFIIGKSIDCSPHKIHYKRSGNGLRKKD